MTLQVELSEELLDLGAAVGLVTLDDPGDPGSARLNEAWFGDPGQYLGGVFAHRAQREALLRLAARQLGNPVGELDLPDVPAGQQWVPLASTATGGLFLVVEDEGDGAVLGLGARAADPVLAVTLHLPVLRVGGDSAGFVVGTAAGTLSLAASAVLDGGPAPGGVALDRAALSMAVPTDGSDPSFTIALTGLRLDGDGQPRDVLVRSGEPAGELLDTALTVLRGLVLEGAAGSPLAHLLALAGLGGDPGLPTLDLAGLLAGGTDALVAWLRALAADLPGVRAWLGHLAGLLGLDPLAAVNGDGTAGAPLAVSAAAGGAEVAFTVTLASAASTGDPVLRPGLRVRVGAPAGFPGRAEGAVELAEIQVGDTISARPLPAGRLIAHLGPDLPLPPGDDPLVATTLPDGTDASVGALEAGLALDGAGRPVLVLAALDVTVAGDPYPVVDLTMPDAVRELVDNALDAVIDGLLGTLGSSVEATALLALLGLRRPAGLDPAAPWPHAAAPPAFFSDPLGAVAGFHAQVLAAGDWGTLAGELATLLRGGDRPAAATGAGTEADPWTVELAQDTLGTAELAVWGGGGNRLHLGVLLRPAPVPLGGGAELRPGVSAELLSLELAPGGAAEALPGAVLTLAVGDDLPVDLGMVALDIGSVAVDLRWRRDQGVALRIGAADVVAEVEGTTVPLPIPVYDSAAGTPALPADFPWPVITRLLGDALLTRGVAWLEGLATLTRWDQGLPSVVTFPAEPAGVPVGDLPGLPVERLPADPLGVVRDWVAQLLADIAGPAAVQLAAWIGSVTAGAVPGAGPFGVQLGGGGMAADPWAAGLGTATDAAELLVWFEPDGTALFGVPELVLPPELTGSLDLLIGEPPEPEELARLLREAARSVPELAPVVDGRPGLGAGLAQLVTRLADSDGLVPVASQRPAGATAGQVLDGLTHLEAPLGFDPATHLPPGTDPTQVLYVVEPLAGLADWPHRGTAPLLDLTEPGLAPEALDLSGVAGPGPWFVRLATRAAAGDADRQAARLGRAVAAALATLPSGATLTVVAHGPAALAARRLAATAGAGIAQLITLAAPLDGTTFEFLDEPVVGDSVRALQALVPLLSDPTRKDPPVADGLALVDTLGTLLDPGSEAAFPVADYRLDGPAETLPAGTSLTAVTVAFTAPDVMRAVAALVRQAIADTLDRLRTDRPADAIGTGVRVRLGTDQPATGRVETRVEVRVDLHRVLLSDTAAEVPLPRMVASVQLRRTDGWLAGGPRSDHDPTLPREPRLRWAELSVTVEPGPGGMRARTQLVLHEAAALGVSRPRWVVDLAGGDGLVEEARVLLGRLASALAEPDAGPATASVAELFRALGLLAGDGPDPGFVVDAVEQLLVDPATLLATRLADPATADPLLGALRALAGPPLDPGEDLAVAAGGLELGLRLTGAPALVLRTAAGGLPLAAGLSLSGRVEVPADGLPRVALRLAPAGPLGPAGSFALVLGADPAAPAPVTLALEATTGSGAATAAELFPVPDAAALTDVLARLVPAELVRLGLGFAAEAAPAVVEPLLEAVGLRRPGDPPGHLRHPAGLLADPIGWLGHDSLLGGGPGPDGAAVQRLVDGLRTLVGGAGPAGTLPLPWGLLAEAGPAVTGGGVDLQVGWTEPQVAGAVALAATLALQLPGGGPPAATLAASVGITAAAGTAQVEVALGAAPRLVLRVTPSGDSEVVVSIVPPGGAGELAEEGVELLLPAVLDALTDAGAGGGPLAAVGQAVADLGDALGLRTADGFDGQALTELAGDPAGQLVSRIRSSAAGQEALAALAALVAPVLPSGAVAVDPAARTVRVAISGSPVELTFSVPATGTPQLCGVVTGFEPTAGLRLDAVLCVSPGGLRRLELHAEVVDEGLLDAGGFAFFPFAAALFGPDAPAGGDRFEVGLWLAPPAATDRDALVLRLPVGAAASVVCRPTDGPEHPDLVPCVEAATRAYLVPLLVDLVVALDPVEGVLDRNLAILGGTLGELLDGIVLGRPVPTGPFHLDPAALDPANLLDRLLELGLRLAERSTGALSPAALAPFTVSLLVESGAVDRGGLRLSASVGQGLTLIDTGEVAIELEADPRWFVTGPQPADGRGGLTLLLVAGDGGGFRLEPELRVEGLGLRVSSPSSDKLVDLGVTIGSVAAYAALDRRGAGGGEVARIGGQLVIDGLGVPLGNATGDNPVAGKILSSGSDSSQAGDTEELAPTFSPAVVLWQEGGELSVLVRAGPPPGPWWLPLQRSFGPIYVEQVGVGAEDSDGTTTALQLLLDGGLEMLGLAVQVDDLSVTIPTATPLQPDTWRLGLAGLAVGMDASGLRIAGGLRERRPPTPPNSQPLPPDYVGMVRVEFAQYGITAIGGYGEFPDDAGGTYTSFFLFGALSAPIGGPPAFFVTGIGAGAGINRRLVVPDDIAQLPGFPLVAAMDPSSDLATDPMGALDLLGESFPAERGTFWFAAGVRFTSFVVVESIAVLSVEIGDGLEVNLLGLSRMDLPSPLTPMARIELALRARFSSSEGVLSVIAQLTDNSWIINESCRLTGGFAFVIWFPTGQFVLTLGGYHPRFAKPAEFPLVPRLGFVWQVSDILSIKGESYFALTASCVMAGAKLDASLDAGWIWGRLVVGFDALVSWDPFFYDIGAYVSVSVGFKIEICVPILGCARIRFSMSIGADLRILGPELRGTAKLDLDVTSFTVAFGATGAPASSQALGWHEFYDKYLVAGDDQRRVLDVVVTKGGLALPSGDEPDDGSAGRPFRLLPEFVLTTSTRAASTEINSDAVTGAAGLPLGVGPMKVDRITSNHTISLVDPALPEDDLIGSLAVTPVLGFVPAAVWEVNDGTEPPAEAKVRPAAVGATLVAAAEEIGTAVPLPVDDVDPPGPRHPLPFHQEQAGRPSLEEVREEADRFGAEQPKGTAAILQRAARYLTTGVFQPTELTTLERRAFAADRVGPPRLAPLTEGIVDPVKPAAEVTDRPPPEPDPDPDTTVLPPVLDAQLRLLPPGTSVASAATTVSHDLLAGRRVRRRLPPTLADVRSQLARTPMAAQLTVDPPPAVPRVTPAVAPTVVAAGATPHTRVAGGLAERRRGLLSSQTDVEALAKLTGQLPDGVPLRPGDVQVWRLPNSAADVAGERPRPGLRVQGDQLVRVVALDRAGEVLSDRTGRRLSVQVPLGAHRLVAAGLGGTGDAPPAGLPGWHAGSTVAQVTPDVYLAAGAVVRAEASRTVRSRRTVGSALVPAGEAVAGIGSVVTRLPGGLEAVLLALDTEGAVDASLDGLVLGVQGAKRAGEPRVVTAGDRVYAVFPLDPTAEGPAAPVTVTVGSDDRWLLAGVVGSPGPPGDLAERVAADGLADRVAELVEGALGASVVRWIGG